MRWSLVTVSVSFLTGLGLLVSGCFYRESRRPSVVQSDRTADSPPRSVSAVQPNRSSASRPREVTAVSPAEPGPPAAPAIEIDQNVIGAEAQPQPIETFEKPLPDRRFAFLVTGYGVESKSSNPVERKSAAIEAAIVEAVGLALREMQRDPQTGRVPIEYKLSPGSGLTVFGQLVGGTPQTVILFERKGRDVELCARAGVLAHPPHDAKIIQEIFAATQGRLVLQATRATDQPGRYSADVGCYHTTDSGPATSSTERSGRGPIVGRVE